MCFALVGCNQDAPTETPQTEHIEEKPFTVKESQREGDQSTKEVVDSNEIKIVTEMIEDAEWEENIEVDMVYPPDYRFRLDSISYAIWVTPNRDGLEIIAEGQSKYIKLPVQDSEILYEIMTGKEL